MPKPVDVKAGGDINKTTATVIDVIEECKCNLCLTKRKPSKYGFYHMTARSDGSDKLMNIWLNKDDAISRSGGSEYGKGNAIGDFIDAVVALYPNGVDVDGTHITQKQMGSDGTVKDILDIMKGRRYNFEKKKLGVKTIKPQWCPTKELPPITQQESLDAQKRRQEARAFAKA